jgi:K+-sensing histidine kinase KdpD
VLVDERTKSLKKTNDELESSNKQNEMLISVMAHDVKSPLRFLADVSDNLYNNWDKIAEDRKKSYGLEIKKSTKTLAVFMNDFLLWIKLKRENVLVNKENVNVLSLLNKVATYHQESGNCGTNVLEVKAGSEIQVKTNQKYLEIILSNLLDNACKYTKNGNICLAAFTNENVVEISCKDTGKGMSKEKIDRLLFGEDMDELDRKDSFKLGYRFIQDMIKLIGAKLEIISEVNEGTEVKVILINS